MELAGPEGQTSNSLLEILAGWSDYLAWLPEPEITIVL